MVRILVKIFSPSAQDSWWNRKTLGEIKIILVKCLESWWNCESLGEIEFHQDKNYSRNIQHITLVYLKLGLSRFRQTGLVQKIGPFTEVRYTYIWENQCIWYMKHIICCLLLISHSSYLFMICQIYRIPSISGKIYHIIWSIY